MKIKAISKSVLLLASLLAMAGCTSIFQDSTPQQIRQNPSGIYTFRFTADVIQGNRIAGSERAQIVINGETFPMARIGGKDKLDFTYDYTMPPGITEARYYYVLSWDYPGPGGKPRTATRYSTHDQGKVYQARLINRYPIQLVNERGPVGSSIAIVGTGFSPQDVVLVGTVEAQTTVHTANSLEFIVPAIPAGSSYRVVLRSSGGDLEAGILRVDAAALRVQPQSLTLNSGQTDFIIIQTDSPAPAGGLYIDAQTDIPDSVVMPEIIVPEGARSVNVNITGGSPGSGVLLLNVPGYAPLEVSVTVR